MTRPMSGSVRKESQPTLYSQTPMYHHIKKLMYTVRVGEPDPRFGNMLLEQFGGANGELAAAMQYSIQGLNCEDPARKDLLMDIGTEELSHLEIVGTLARMKALPKMAKAARSSQLQTLFETHLAETETQVERLNECL